MKKEPQNKKRRTLLPSGILLGICLFAAWFGFFGLPLFGLAK